MYFLLFSFLYVMAKSAMVSIWTGLIRLHFLFTTIWRQVLLKQHLMLNVFCCVVIYWHYINLWVNSECIEPHPLSCACQPSPWTRGLQSRYVPIGRIPSHGCGSYVWYCCSDSSLLFLSLSNLFTVIDRK